MAGDDNTEAPAPESPDSHSPDQAGQKEQGDPEEMVDHAVESFIQIEQEFQELGRLQGRGRAIDVEKVPTAEVPAEYPARIETEQALAIRLSMVEAESETVVIYFEWPQQGTDERLAHLLELNGIPSERFGDLHGEELLLTIEDRYYVPLLPSERPRGDSRGVYGILAGIAPSFLIAGAGLVGAGGLVASQAFLLFWLASTFLLLPAAVYLDAWDLRTSTDWRGGPLFWAVLSVIPAVNVLAVPAYLLSRATAEPII